MSHCTDRLRIPLRLCAGLGLLLGAALQSACAVGPRYTRPAVDTGTQFKEAKGWKIAEPQDRLPAGQWWSAYGDAELNRLIQQVDLSNQNIQEAQARYRQARALVSEARAAYFPTIGASLSAQRQRGAARLSNAVVPNGVNSTYSAALDASWELDVWGRLRRAAENAGANAQASVADLAAARLSAQAELAQDYFQLRITDQEKRLLDENVVGLQTSLKITQNQYAVGVAKRSDVAEALTQLKSTQAQALDVGITRAQLEHAIAVLIGQAPSNFTLAEAPLQMKLPPLPLGLPSELLQRRPDIAGAERRVAAANANIGVAEAAYFPSLTLSGTYGYQSSEFQHLISAANRIWSVGPALALNLFDGGARRAATHQAIAAYDENVAAYRLTVLTALQDVEDNLVALRVLGDETAVQEEATSAARESETIALNQYKSGIVSYLNVVIAQSTALANERASLALQGRNLAASVALIKALGGGWQVGDKP
jgi:NodT family efflux transporter outer membrane factor (OMF) lipoprotein